MGKIQSEGNRKRRNMNYWIVYYLILIITKTKQIKEQNNDKAKTVLYLCDNLEIPPPCIQKCYFQLYTEGEKYCDENVLMIK